MHFRNFLSPIPKGPADKNTDDQVPIPPMDPAIIGIGGHYSSPPTGDSIPTVAIARNNTSIFQRFRLAHETPVPFHPGFRTNDEEEKLQQPLSLKPSANQLIRKPGEKWD